MHDDVHLMTPLLLEPSPSVLGLDRAAGIRHRDTIGLLRTDALEHLVVVRVDPFELGRERAHRLGTQVVDARRKPSLEVADHELDDLVRRARLGELHCLLRLRLGRVEPPLLHADAELSGVAW
jgi:hypothetical protein